jgi:hypothetical protein
MSAVWCGVDVNVSGPNKPTSINDDQEGASVSVDIDIIY